MSERHACSVVQLHRSSYRYESKPDGNDELRDMLKALAAARPRWGQEWLHVLVRRQGYMVNHKRTERLYRELGLFLRLRRRSKRASTVRVPAAMPMGPHQRWSIDFVSDQLVTGHKLLATQTAHEVPRVSTRPKTTPGLSEPVVGNRYDQGND